MATVREAEADVPGIPWRDALALELGIGTSVRIIPREKKFEGFRRGSELVFGPRSLSQGLFPLCLFHNLLQAVEETF